MSNICDYILSLDKVPYFSSYTEISSKEYSATANLKKVKSMVCDVCCMYCFFWGGGGVVCFSDPTCLPEVIVVSSLHYTTHLSSY